MLGFVNIKNSKKPISKMKELYLSAFPKEERVPFFYLKYKALKSAADFYGIYEESQFIGLLYTVRHKDIVFLFYLAVSEGQRGNGYGSRVLEEVKRRFKGFRIILNIEELVEESENYRQQKKRKKFYVENGFEVADLKTKEKDVIYEMLYFGGNVSYEEYSGLMRNYLGNFIFKMYYEKINVQ